MLREFLADLVQYEQMNTFYRRTRGHVLIGLTRVSYYYTTEGRKATQGSISNTTANCMFCPSHKLNKSSATIVMSKSLILQDPVHLDHNLSSTIGPVRRFCLIITQSATFTISFHSPGDKNKNRPP